MALPPLELFSLEEKAVLLPGGLFVCKCSQNRSLCFFYWHFPFLRQSMRCHWHLDGLGRTPCTVFATIARAEIGIFGIARIVLQALRSSLPWSSALGWSSLSPHYGVPKPVT